MSGVEGRPVPVGDKRSGYPASPCVSICTLDDQRRCLGCGRTLEEIAGWARMSKHEQWAVVERLRGAHRIAEKNECDT